MLLLLSTSACSTAPSNTSTCPAIVSYTPADQVAAYHELNDGVPKPQLTRQLGDYIGLRDQVRACQKAAGTIPKSG